MQEADESQVTKEFQKILKEKEIMVEESYVKNVVSLIKERAVFVEDLWDQGYFFFVSPTSFEPKDAKKAWKEGSAELMNELKTFLEGQDNFETEQLEADVKNWIKSKEIGFGKVMMPLRLALVGALQGPDVYEIASYIGKQQTLSRLTKAIETLG